MPNFEDYYMKKYFAYILFLFLPLGFPMQTLGQTLSCIYESQEVMSCADSCTIANCAPYASERHYKLEERTPPKKSINQLYFSALQQEINSTDSRFGFYFSNDSHDCVYCVTNSLCCACYASNCFCFCMQDSIPRHSVMALKTNLLYDALTLLNISLEMPLGNKFSMLAYYQFPWWRGGQADNEYCLRFLSLGMEARWWFALQPKPATIKHQERDRFVGHFLGVYAESGKWDFEHKRKICHQGEFWSAGLSYGYSVPIGRRMNMEFSLSVGYASIPYRGFTPSEDYEILWRDHDKVGCWDYFGPTKAQISLVMPIKAKKNNKKEKGGCQ